MSKNGWLRSLDEQIVSWVYETREPHEYRRQSPDVDMLLCEAFAGAASELSGRCWLAAYANDRSELEIVDSNGRCLLSWKIPAPSHERRSVGARHGIVTPEAGSVALFTLLLARCRLTPALDVQFEDGFTVDRVLVTADLLQRRYPQEDASEMKRMGTQAGLLSLCSSPLKRTWGPN